MDRSCTAPQWRARCVRTVLLRMLASPDVSTDTVLKCSSGKEGVEPQVRLRFGAFADAYDEGRPAYPSVAIRWLLDGNRGLVAELGAGTGKMTETLVQVRTRIVAIEPDGRMITHLRRRVPEVMAIQACAERLPLASGSVGAVVAAQAWHWFDQALALQEVARVCGKGGRLGVIWNAPRPRSRWQATLCDIGPELSPVSEDWWPKGFPRRNTESCIFTWRQRMAPSDVRREHSTHVAVQSMSESERTAYLDEVEEIAMREAARRRDRLVSYDRLTWCARRSAHEPPDM